MTQGINYNAKTIEDAAHYMDYRSIQLRTLGYKLVDKETLSNYGIVYTYIKDGQHYFGLYVLYQHRNNGYYYSYAKKMNSNGFKVITLKDCNLEQYLINKKITYTCEDFSPEYKVIERYYGDKIAERSKVLKMNHINEGLLILNAIEASEYTKKAYCLHPILQSDNDLKDNYRRRFHEYSKDTIIDSQSIILAMEYRRVANDYLSNKKIESISDIKLSPLREVNEMLIADKVQNYKDFMKYHGYSHPNRRELFTYFQNWFEKLNIDQNVEKLLDIIKEY